MKNTLRDWGQVASSPLSRKVITSNKNTAGTIFY
jgi:hypothetical protein